MKRILLTGMSGAGKSTLVDALAALGYAAVDADCDAYSQWIEVSAGSDVPGTPVEPDRDWVWREDRIQELLSDEAGDMLFLSGCASNMGRFLPQFDHVVLLSAPADVILQRLAERTGNSYGQRPEEAARVLELMESVEPLLRRAADHEIDTSAPLDVVIMRVLQIAAQEKSP
ncbi:MAG: AAA family ATPase [Caldilineales bacterium]